MNPGRQVQLPEEYKSQSVKFCGRTFYVDSRVHIPRRNTEPLVRAAKQYINRLAKDVMVADVGTGAEVIAITLVLECPMIKTCYASEPFQDALEVAKINVEQYMLEDRITLYGGNLFEPLNESHVDIIVANLPHASEKKLDKLKQSTKEHEPFNGYYGGETGLELYEKLFSQITEFNKQDALSGIFIKISPDHRDRIEQLYSQYLSDFKLNIIPDEEGKDRVVSFTK